MDTSKTRTEFFETKVLGHPAGLMVLFFTEMWERFSFYGMRVLLVNFLTMAAISYNPGWEWTAENAGALFGTYAGLLYLTPILGGMIADKYGSGKTLTVGILLGLLGIILIPYSTTAFTLSISLGVISSIGLGVAGLPVVLASVNRLIPQNKVGMAFGLVNAGQSLGQLILAPLAGFIIVNFGWILCILFLCTVLLLVLPFSFTLRSRTDTKQPVGVQTKSLSETLRIAFNTPSYIYLVVGFFVCGFHVFYFIC